MIEALKVNFGGGGWGGTGIAMLDHFYAMGLGFTTRETIENGNWNWGLVKFHDISDREMRLGPPFRTFLFE